MTTEPAGNTFTGTVQAGDTLEIQAGAGSDGALVLGTETVDFGGIADTTTVGAGGQFDDNGVAYSTVVDTGAYASVTGLSIGATVSGFELVGSGGTSVGDTASAGGAIVVDGTADSDKIAGGTLNLAASTATVGDDIEFTSPSGLLELSVGNDITAPIQGFAPGDEISISGLSTAPGATFAVSGDTVTISDAGKSYALNIVGASTDNLTLADVNSTLTVESICFLAGTTIATPDGGRAIETLRAGDLVLTADGAVRPVRWLGRQTIATRFADRLRVAPIRILAGALAENLPVRDLLVSPDHALMVDGVFVQAGALVNGVSITREDADLPETFVYYHVELADHALILAEGVPAETFIDNVDRLAFDNWDEHEALAAGSAPMTELPHARAKSHRQVPQALRAALLARGVALTGATTIASVA